MISKPFSKLWRNRITLLVLPVALLFISLALFAMLVLDFDLNALVNFIFIMLNLFIFILFFWRIKFPISLWSFLIFIEPHNARFYNNRATAYLGRGDYEHALENYNIGIQLQPKAKILAFLYNGRLALFSQMGRYAEALQDAERGFQSRPTKLASATLLYNRGYTYQQLFVYEAALQDYELCISTSRLLTPIAHLSQGLIYAAQGNYQLALQEEDACMQKRPRLPVSYTNRAIIHLKFRQYQRALEDANQALKRCQPAMRLLTRRGGAYPYAANVYTQRALAYCGQQNYQAALEDARKAVELAPVYGPNFYSLGQVYLAINDILQARQTFQQGFAADPQDVSNAALLAWTTMDAMHPNIEQASFLSDAAHNYPESEWSHLCQGMSAWLRNDYANARAHLSHAQQLDVMNPHPYFWLGMLHTSLEEDSLAQSALQQAIQLGLSPVLLTLLQYFEQKRPDFYQSTLQPFLVQ